MTRHAHSAAPSAPIAAERSAQAPDLHSPPVEEPPEVHPDEPPTWSAHALRYAFAVGCAAALLAASGALEDLLHGFVFSLPVAGVSLVVYFLGPGPALAFTAIVGLGFWRFFQEPFRSHQEVARLAAFTVASLAIVAAVRQLQRTQRRLLEEKDRVDRAEQELRRSNALLRETDRRKDEFLGVLSHELRNPLAPIRNALSLLARVDPCGDEAARARAILDRQVVHLTRIVDDLLDVTRITRGKILLRRSRVELGDLVRRTVEDHRTLFASREIAVEVSLPEGPAWLDADATRVAQVIGNLLQNAAKFTDRGGHVEVTLERDTGARAGILLRVRDDGAGIDVEMLDRVFEPFTQADDSLHRSRGGLGLGLSLVKGLVELHGGSVEARSGGAGRGAELVVRLPLAPPDGGSPRHEPPAPVAAVGPLRVLVIEDNVDAAETLRELLLMWGHEVAVAHDGAAGVERARALRPEVVLCDIGLPVMSGYEVARAIRADPTLGATFLVAVTGYALPEDRRLAADAGFSRHLAKPVAVETLERLLAAAPRSRQA
ncbi:MULTISPECIES: ATP-binding protein [Anaeromyxobacter]|uniref:ATP-binding protein n=1 Tax=Anaeromyxobacter TaxID=161492 RepID=UPI001F5806FF|nr:MULTISPECIES: ATP-binding protein [unclassified Anaeromyxobacter]